MVPMQICILLFHHEAGPAGALVTNMAGYQGHKKLSPILNGRIFALDILFHRALTGLRPLRVLRPGLFCPALSALAILLVLSEMVAQQEIAQGACLRFGI
jgi:hypothetical protein